MPSRYAVLPDRYGGIAMRVRCPVTIEPEAAAAVTGAGWLAVLSVFVRRLLNEHDNKASKDELRAAILEAKERDIRAEHSRERLFAGSLSSRIRRRS